MLHLDPQTVEPERLQPLEPELFRRPVAAYDDEFDLDAAGDRIWRGPLYPRLPELDRFRRLANGATETPDQARAYGRAVGEAFRKLNRISASRPISTACTAETSAKCRARHIAELRAAADADRRRRTDKEIVVAYHAAMHDKRERERIAGEGPCLRTAQDAVDAPEWTALLKWDMGREPANANCARKVPAVEIRLSEAERAKAWREKEGLTRDALANHIGFSVSQIVDYEQGARRNKEGAAAVISDAAWRRYRLACAAYAAGLGEAW